MLREGCSEPEERTGFPSLGPPTPRLSAPPQLSRRTLSAPGGEEGVLTHLQYLLFT